MTADDPKAWGPLLDTMLDARRQLIHLWIEAGRTPECIAEDLSCDAVQVLAILAATVGGTEGNVMLPRPLEAVHRTRQPGTLTLEQIEKGRSMVGDHVESVRACGAWLIANAEQLFAAAEATARGEVSAVTNNGGLAPRLSDAEISDALDVLWAAAIGDGRQMWPRGREQARSIIERAIVELWYRRGWKGPRK